MTEKQAMYLVKRGSLNTSWDNFLDAMKVIKLQHGLHDYVLNYTKKNLPSLKFSNIKPYLFISNNSSDGGIVYALNAIQSFGLKEFNKEEFVEPFLEFIKTENKTMNFYIEKIKKRILDEESKKNTASEIPKTPKIKKTQFKEAVLNKLHLVESEGLKELLVWEPERLMYWTRELGKYPVEEVYNGIKRWGEESNIEAVQTIYKLSKMFKKTDSFMDVFDKFDELDIETRKMPRRDGFIYQILKDFTIMKHPSVKDLLPIVNYNRSYSSEVAEIMAKEKMYYFAREECEELKRKVEGNLIAKQWNQIIKMCSINFAKEDQVTSPKKPKMNIKESKEDWADKLIKWDDIVYKNSYGNAHTVYAQALHEATNFIIKNLRNCDFDDFVDLCFCYALMGNPGIIRHTAAALSTLKPEVRKEIMNAKKEDHVGISEHFFTFQKQIKKEEEMKNAKESDPIVPKVKKTSFKENKFERMFDYLNEETNG